ARPSVVERRRGAGARGMSGRARRYVLALPAAWLALFFLVPFLIVLGISFAEQAVGIPPYALRLSLDNYALLAGDALYARAYLDSILYAAFATALALLVGYPM